MSRQYFTNNILDNFNYIYVLKFVIPIQRYHKLHFYYFVYIFHNTGMFVLKMDILSKPVWFP